MNEERALQSFVSDAIHDGLVKSAHDISRRRTRGRPGRMCYSTLQRPAIGAAVKIPQYMEACKDLFGEYSSRILLTYNTRF